jgi:hypothetical protein
MRPTKGRQWALEMLGDQVLPLVPAPTSPTLRRVCQAALLCTLELGQRWCGERRPGS